MSVLRDIFSGTLWVIAARWLIRGIGLISTIFLARLLTPADFGVVAMATLAIGLLQVFGDTGMVMFIIRHPDPQRRHFDTVWTLRIIVGLVIALAMLLVAPWAAGFFHEPRITAVIRILALQPLLMGLENPGIIWFRKNMVFSKDFEFLVLNKIVSFVLTIGLALTLRNYWALVIGILIGSVTSTLQSFRMHPYRPRLDLSEVRAMWAFSFWILAQNVLGFLNARVDELIVGRIKSTTMMGYYNIAADVASSPVQEIILPLSRVLFPGIAQLAHQKEALAATFEKVVASVVIVVLSVSIGIALVAADFVAVFLGDRWLPIIPLVRILAVATGILALGQPFLILLNVTDRSRTAATLSLVRQMLLMAAMVPAAIYADLQAVALARAGATLAVLALTLAVTSGLVRMNLWNLLRPVLAAVAMCGGVMLVQALSPDLPWLRLVLGVATGAMTYGGTLLVLWLVAGRPAGVESDMLAALTTRLTGLCRQPR